MKSLDFQPESIFENNQALKKSFIVWVSEKLKATSFFRGFYQMISVLNKTRDFTLEFTDKKDEASLFIDLDQETDQSVRISGIQDDGTVLFFVPFSQNFVSQIQYLMFYDLIILSSLKLWQDTVSTDSLFQPKVIKSDDEIEELLKKYQTLFDEKPDTSLYITFDIETTGLNPLRSKLISIAFYPFVYLPDKKAYIESEAIYFLPISLSRSKFRVYNKWPDLSNDLTEDGINQFLSFLLKHPKVYWIAYNAPFDLWFLFQHYGSVFEPKLYFDPMIGYYILYNVPSIGLKQAEQIYFNRKVEVDTSKILDLSFKDLVHYNCSDVFFTTRLTQLFLYLIPESQYEYTRNLHHLQQYIALLKYSGIAINKRKLDEFKGRYVRNYSQYQQRFAKLLIEKESDRFISFMEYCKERQLWESKTPKTTKDRPLLDILIEVTPQLKKKESNIPEILDFAITFLNSNKLTRTYVYDVLKAPLVTTAKGNPSLTSEIIHEHIESADPEKDRDLLEVLLILNEWLEYKREAKRFESFMKYIDLDNRVHPEWQTTISRSGRVYARNPSTQNLPRSFFRLFGPEPGWVLLSIDYQQIEVRVLAWLTRSEFLQKALAEGRDIHTEITKVIFPSLKTKEEIKKYRAIGKMFVFASVYGKKADALYKQIKGQGIDFLKKRDVERAYKRLMELIPGRQDLISRNHEFMKENGFIQTPTKRRRYLFFEDRILDNEAKLEHVLINNPIQSFAFDLVIISLDRFFQTILKKNPDWLDKTKLVSLLHDEIVLEVQTEIKDGIKDMAINTLQFVLPPNLPFLVDIHEFDEAWEK